MWRGTPRGKVWFSKCRVLVRCFINPESFLFFFLSLLIILCNLQCFHIREILLFLMPFLWSGYKYTMRHIALYTSWIIQLQICAVGVSLSYLQVNHICLNPETFVGIALQSHKLSSLFISELLTLLKLPVKVLHWSCTSCHVLVRDMSGLLFTLSKFCVQKCPRPPLEVV